MRAGPLSSPEVIALLNRSFVPVYAVNEDYRDGGDAPREEKAEYQRIYRESLAAGFSTGTVHAYVLDPEGHPVGTLHVAEAAKPAQLIALLERVVRDLKPAAGRPLVEPRSQSTPPDAPTGSLVLHLTARGHGSSWDGFPSENWIVLDPEDAKALTPSGDVKVGTSWDINTRVATELLTHFYPQTENNDVSTHRFDRRSLRGTVVSINDGLARARLEGDLRMKHTFYPRRDDDNFVEATVVGLLDIELATGRIRRLQLVTDQATYGKGTLDVAVRSLP